MCNEKKGKRCDWRGTGNQVEEEWACVSVLQDSRTFNSTKESHIFRRVGGGGGLMAGAGWGGGTRRRCMKAKALQTIVTLYMTSSCYNNTAVIYCTVQVRDWTYGWIKLIIIIIIYNIHKQHQFCPDSVFLFFLFFIFLLYFSTLCHLCICSSTVHGSVYIHTLNTTWKK